MLDAEQRVLGSASLHDIGEPIAIVQRNGEVRVYVDETREQRHAGEVRHSCCVDGARWCHLDNAITVDVNGVALEHLAGHGIKYPVRNEDVNGHLPIQP